MRAYIPARAVETIGVLRYVPVSIPNEELFKKLTSKYEIVSVRRFTRKVNGEIKPFTSVSITFLSNSLPDCVYLDIYRFKVYEYVAPLLQCFKCFKFNHGAKICKSTQNCSICAEDHHYSECTNNSVMKCLNCGDSHLAISRDCPVKKRKIEEKNNRSSYVNVLSKNFTRNYNNDFPNLPQKSTKQTLAKLNPPNLILTVSNDKRISVPNSDKETISKDQLVDQIIKNEYVLKGLIGALVTLGNDNQKLTTTHIKEVLINSLKNG